MTTNVCCAVGQTQPVIPYSPTGMGNDTVAHRAGKEGHLATTRALDERTGDESREKTTTLYDTSPTVVERCGIACMVSRRRRNTSTGVAGRKSPYSHTAH